MDPQLIATARRKSESAKTAKRQANDENRKDARIEKRIEADWPHSGETDRAGAVERIASTIQDLGLSDNVRRIKPAASTAAAAALDIFKDAVDGEDVRATIAAYGDSCEWWEEFLSGPWLIITRPEWCERIADVQRRARVVTQGEVINARGAVRAGAQSEATGEPSRNGGAASDAAPVFKAARLSNGETVSDQMMRIYTRDKGCIDWSKATWSTLLECSRSAIQNAPAWSAIQGDRRERALTGKDRAKRRA